MITNLRLKLLEQPQPDYVTAVLAGMPPARVSEYAAGKRKIPFHHVVALCEVMDCEPEDIVGWAEQDEYGTDPVLLKDIEPVDL